MLMPINLGEMLIKEGHISPQQLEEALAYQKKERGALGQILLKLGFLAQDQLTEVLARQYGVPGVDLAQSDIPPGVIRLIPRETAERYRLIPFSRMARI